MTFSTFLLFCWSERIDEICILNGVYCEESFRVCLELCDECLPIRPLLSSNVKEGARYL